MEAPRFSNLGTWRLLWSRIFKKKDCEMITTLSKENLRILSLSPFLTITPNIHNLDLNLSVGVQTIQSVDK